MQVPAAIVRDTGIEGIAADMFVELLARDEARLPVAEFLFQRRHLGPHPALFRRAMRDEQGVGLEVAANAVLRDPLADDGAALLGQVEQRLGAIAAIARDQL